MNFQRQGHTVKLLFFSAGEVYEVGYVADFGTTEQGEKGCTCICIMEKGRFEKWLLEWQNNQKHIRFLSLFALFSLISENIAERM